MCVYIYGGEEACTAEEHTLFDVVYDKYNHNNNITLRGGTRVYNTAVVVCGPGQNRRYIVVGEYNIQIDLGTRVSV